MTIASILQDKLEGFKAYKDYYVALCPFHNDSNPSLSISKSGVWHCFGCEKKGNLYTLANALNFEITSKIRLDTLLDKNERKEYTNLASYNISLPYSFYQVCHPLMRRRTTNELIDKYKLGLAPQTYKDYFVIPIEIPAYYAYQCRHYISSPPIGVKRWLFPSGFTKVIFPWHDKPSDLILTEGFFSMLKCEERGYQASCIFGQQLSNLQVELLIRMSVQRIFVCFDGNEEESLSNAISVSKKLVDYFTVFIIILNEGDPEEVSKREFDIAFFSSINFSDCWDKKQKKRSSSRFDKIIRTKRV